MAKFMKYVWYLYALIFVIIILGAVLSFFGFFSHEYMDPAM